MYTHIPWFLLVLEASLKLIFLELLFLHRITFSCLHVIKSFAFQSLIYRTEIRHMEPYLVGREAVTLMKYCI